MTEIVTVTINCPDAASATAIAEAALTRRLAASANIGAEMTSLYTWRGRAERRAEVALLLKTRATHFDALAALARALHPYELPSVIAHPLAHVTEDYRAWVLAETEAGG